MFFRVIIGSNIELLKPQHFEACVRRLLYVLASRMFQALISQYLTIAQYLKHKTLAPNIRTHYMFLECSWTSLNLFLYIVIVLLSLLV